MNAKGEGLSELASFTLRGRKFRLWLKDYLELHDIKNAVLVLGYSSPDKNKGEQ